MAIFWFDAKAGIAISFNFTNADDFSVEKHQQVRCLECKKEVSGNFIKRKFKKANSANFIKIAYSGNSMDTDTPNQNGFATPPATHLFPSCMAHHRHGSVFVVLYETPVETVKKFVIFCYRRVVF